MAKRVSKANVVTSTAQPAQSVNPKWPKAFNDWMQDFVNNPEAFESITASALQFLRDRTAGSEPSYGEQCAACFQAYLDAQ